MNRDLAIKVEGVSKRYRLYPTVWNRIKHDWLRMPSVPYEEVYALCEVDLSVRTGESLAILGVNGSGKSTLLKIISGVTTPSAGQVAVRGSVALILELGTGFVPEFTGRVNAYFGAYIHGFSQAQIAERMPDIEKFAEIGSYMDQPVKYYSSGMYSRLAIAVAFHLSTDILIIDEALAVGDVFFRQKCFDYLNDQLKDRTKIFVTHNLDLVSSFADRVLVLHKGRVVFFGDKLEGLRTHQGLRGGIDVSAEVLAGAEERRRNSVSKIGTFNHSTAIAVDQEKLIGQGEVVIEKVVVYVDGETSRTVHKGCHVGLDILVRCDKEFTEKMVFGYSLRDANSLQILASDTEISGLELPDLETGRYIVRMEFDWPDVKPGTYTLTLGMAEISVTGARRRQCHAADFLALEALKTNPVHGILNSPLTYFEISQTASDGD